MNNQDRHLFYTLGKDAGRLAVGGQAYDKQIEEAVEWLAIATRSERRPLIISFLEGVRNCCRHQYIYDKIDDRLTNVWLEMYNYLEESSQ